MLSTHVINVSKHGIQKIIQKYNTKGLYEDRKRSGRPPKLSKRSMCVIRRTCQQNRAMSLTKISNAFNVGKSVHIGRDTVGRILKHTAFVVIDQFSSLSSLQSSGKE